MTKFATFFLLIIGISYSSFSFGNSCESAFLDLPKIPIEVKPLNSSDGVGIPAIDTQIAKSLVLQRLFERTIGITKFNRKVYIPALELLKNDYESVVRSAQENSFYDLPKDAELLATRLFVEALFLSMKIEYNLERKDEFAQQLTDIVPPWGEPGVFVANHPYGAVETLLVARALMQRRPDVKFVAQSMVGDLLPLARGILFSAQIIKGVKKDQQTNPVDQATDFLNDEGGLVVIFPDPSIPIRTPWYSGSKVAKQEMDFKTGAIRIAVATDAPIIMGHIFGGIQNSRFFHLVAKIHLYAKLARGIHELVRTQGTQTYEIELAEAFRASEQLDLLGVDIEDFESLPLGERKKSLRSLTKTLRELYVDTFPDVVD